MNHPSHLLLKGLKLSVFATLVVSVSTYAYEQGKGSIATVNPEDKVEKIDTITSNDKQERIKGNFNRSGNPVRVIWYGNPKDQDGKIAQTGANNQGQIVGKVIAKGLATTETEDRIGAISIDGIANGIDALGWSAPSNANDVVFALQSVENSGTIFADADLQGGEAETHGDIQSYGSGNGISIIGLADFGKHNAEVGSDGIADGYSGATGVSRRSSALRSSRSAVSSSPSSPELDKVDFEGKTVEVSLQNINNSGQILGKIYAQSHPLVTPHTPNYKPQFYSVTSSASGNAISAASYVNTIDKITFSEGKNNFAKLGSIYNSGNLLGETHLLGGKNTTHTGTTSSNSGNGISAVAKTGRFAKNRTESAIGNIQNTGEISGKLVQISGDNSYYQGAHLYSNANAHGSGNAISVTTESSNAQNRYASSAILGDIANQGKMFGKAFVQAGNGTGTLMANVVSSGNGVSAFAQGNSGEIAKIGSVDNRGVIAGYIEVKGGKSNQTASDKVFVPVIEQTKQSINTVSTDSSRLSAETCLWLPKNTPGCESTASSATLNQVSATIQSKTTAHSSGNGISAWTYGESSEYGEQKAQLGSVTNLGTISGYAKVWQGFSQDRHTNVDYRNNGAGIAVNAEMKGNIANAGVISGNHSALLARGKIDTSWSSRQPTYRSGFKGHINNYGILAGRLIVGGYALDHTADQYYRYFETDSLSRIQNAGLYITLNENEQIERVATGTDNAQFSYHGKTYEIENAPLKPDNKDSEKVTSEDATFSNKIINGVGMANGALFAKHNTTLTDTIINGYKTALKVGENSQVMLDNTILNANGFNVNQSEKPLAILGDHGRNVITLANQTIINTDIDLKEGDDELTIADGVVKFNGQTIDMGQGQNKLYLGHSNTISSPIKVDYAIDNAQEMMVNQPTHLFANAKIRGTDSITLNSDLHYQVLSPEMHALFDAQRSQKLALNGIGKFIVETTKAASEYEIKFGGFQLEPNNITFDTNNVLQSAVFKEGKLLIQPKVVMSAEEIAQQAVQKAQLEAELNDAEKSKASLEKALQEMTAERDQAKAQLGLESAKLNDVEATKKELEQHLHDAIAQRDQAKAQLGLESAKLNNVEATKKELEQHLHDAIAQRDQLQAHTEKQAVNLSEKLTELQQKIDQLKEQLAQQQTDRAFSTPFLDAYQSYLMRWKTSGENALESSALTTDKSTQQATQAINQYLAETTERNIYGAMAYQFAQTTRHERHALLATLHRLKEKQWHVATKGIHTKYDYRHSADHATSDSAMLSMHYGVNDTLTAGVYLSSHKHKIDGGYSRLNGKGISFGAYLNKYLDHLSLTLGGSQGQTSFTGLRYISNGYDSHKFDANGKVKAESLYAQAKYAFDLNENWQFVPRFDVAYTRLTQKAINEKGVAGLAIETYRTHRVESRIGQDIIANLPTSNGNVSLKVSADYTAIVAGEKDLVGAFHRDHTFAIKTEPSNHITSVGGGIGYMWHNGIALDLTARKMFSKTGNNTIAEFKLGYTFK